MGLTQYLYQPNPQCNRVFRILLIASLLTVAAYLRFHALADARFTDPDEYRAIAPINIKVPIFSIVYSIPQSFLGKTHAVALYTSAFLGTLLLGIFYYATKIILGERLALTTLALLALSPPMILAARSAYPTSLQLVWLALVAQNVALYKNQKNQKHIRYAAFFSALMLATYIPSYVSILCIAVIFLFIGGRGGNKYIRVQPALSYLAWTVFSFIGTVLAIVIYATGTLNLGIYFTKLIHFKQHTAQFIDLSDSTWKVFPELVFTTYGTSCSIIMATLFTLGSIQAIRLKANSILGLMAFAVGVYIVFSVLGALGMHTAYQRHYLVIVPPILAVSSFGVWEGLIRIAPFSGKAFCVGLLVPFFYMANHVSNWRFSLSPIHEFLKRTNIENNQIITAMDLGKNSGIAVPGGFVDYPQGEFQIDWAQINNLYSLGQAKYLLTSGLGSNARIGFKERPLKDQNPLMTWIHPYWIRHTADAKVQNFNLYDLSMLFDANRL